MGDSLWPVAPIAGDLRGTGAIESRCMAPIDYSSRATPEARIIAAARDGDRDAFNALVARHWRTIVSAARRIIHDYHLAQDVAQEALLRCFQRLSCLDPTRPFLPWAKRIARNIAVDRLRRQRLMVTDLLETERIDVVTCVRDSLGDHVEPPDGARVWRALEELPPDERRLIYLRYGRGLSIDLIARECGRTPGMVKLLLHRGRIQLADSLIPLANQALRNARPPHLRRRKHGGHTPSRSDHGFAK